MLTEAARQQMAENTARRRTANDLLQAHKAATRPVDLGIGCMVFGRIAAAGEPEDAVHGMVCDEGGIGGPGLPDDAPWVLVTRERWKHPSRDDNVRLPDFAVSRVPLAWIDEARTEAANPNHMSRMAVHLLGTLYNQYRFGAWLDDHGKSVLNAALTLFLVAQQLRNAGLG